MADRSRPWLIDCRLCWGAWRMRGKRRKGRRQMSVHSSSKKSAVLWNPAHAPLLRKAQMQRRPSRHREAKRWLQQKKSSSCVVMFFVCWEICSLSGNLYLEKWWVTVQDWSLIKYREMRLMCVGGKNESETWDKVSFACVRVTILLILDGERWCKCETRARWRWEERGGERREREEGDDAGEKRKGKLGGRRNLALNARKGELN